VSLVALLLALPAACAGLWYLVNPNAATRLATLGEDVRANGVRVRLRRVNGGVLLAAGLLLYYVVSRAQQIEPGQTVSKALPIAVLLLTVCFVVMLVLAWLDWRLTRKLRRNLLAVAARGAIAMTLLLAGCDDPQVVPSQAPPTPVAEVETAPPPPPPPVDPATRPDETPQVLPTITMTIGDTKFELMVADEPAELAKGLMFRRQMGQNEGMLFVFPNEARRSFWMRNTYLALDILFLDRDGNVLNIAKGKPLDRRRSLRSRGAAKYVIELHRGRAREVGVTDGSSIDLSPIVK
jgi:uncharacterized membrane protein (UPF0127 family)